MSYLWMRAFRRAVAEWLRGGLAAAHIGLLSWCWRRFRVGWPAPKLSVVSARVALVATLSLYAVLMACWSVRQRSASYLQSVFSPALLSSLFKRGTPERRSPVACALPPPSFAGRNDQIFVRHGTSIAGYRRGIVGSSWPAVPAPSRCSLEEVVKTTIRRERRWDELC